MLRGSNSANDAGHRGVLSMTSGDQRRKSDILGNLVLMLFPLVE